MTWKMSLSDCRVHPASVGVVMMCEGWIAASRSERACSASVRAVHAHSIGLYMGATSIYIAIVSRSRRVERSYL